MEIWVFQIVFVRLYQFKLSNSFWWSFLSVFPQKKRFFFHWRFMFFLTERNPVFVVGRGNLNINTTKFLTKLSVFTLGFFYALQNRSLSDTFRYNPLLISSLSFLTIIVFLKYRKRY